MDTDMQATGAKASPKALIPFIGLVLLVGLFLVVLLVMRGGKSVSQNMGETVPTTATADTTTATEEVDAVVRNGSLQLVVDGAEEGIKVGTKVRIVVQANSAGEPITGYDVVLQLPSDGFEYVSTESVHASYEVRDSVAGDTVSITGYKPLSEDEEIMLDGDELVAVNLVPKKQGTYSIKIIATPGATDDSNLINTTTVDILGSVEDLMLDVE